MARHSTGTGLALFCWLYSDEPSSVTPAVTLDRTNKELAGAGSSCGVSIKKIIHIVSMLMSQFFNSNSWF